VLGILVFVVAGGVIAATSYASQQARKRAIEETFRTLGAEPRRVIEAASIQGVGLWAIEGRLHGQTVRYGLRAGGKNTPKRTVCVASVPAATALEMELRPETARELRNLEHGRAIDLVLGDDAFDDSFIVEAAPSDMARALLDRNTRTALLAFHPCVLTLSGTELRFVKTGWLDEHAEIARVLALCADVASRLGALPALVLEQRLAERRESEPDGYRGASPGAMRALERSPRDASELAALHQARSRRQRFTWMMNLGVVAIAVALGIAIATMHGR
jgi:hypothetical protein